MKIRSLTLNLCLFFYSFLFHGVSFCYRISNQHHLKSWTQSWQVKGVIKEEGFAADEQVDEEEDDDDEDYEVYHYFTNWLEIGQKHVPNKAVLENKSSTSKGSFGNIFLWNLMKNSCGKILQIRISSVFTQYKPPKPDAEGAYFGFKPVCCVFAQWSCIPILIEHQNMRVRNSAASSLLNGELHLTTSVVLNFN